MPRGPRKRCDSGIYHVILRGINKQIIFESDEDRYEFLSKLKYFINDKKFVLYGYCLMDNHVHLLIRESEDDISTIIKRISSSYVLWYNKKYERCGHLFQERFKSEPVETESYLLTVLRYIHKNPIKAGLCKDMLEYKWTSYREYIQISIITDTEFCLKIFSNDCDIGINIFIEYMNENNDDVCLEFNNFLKLTDSEVITKIYELGVMNISDIQHLNKYDRNQILKEIKKIEGVSLRQLSRITGVSKSVIGSL